VQGNQRLAALLKREKDVTVHCHPAETFQSPAVDLVFTSPPYFNQERYSQGVDQSWQKHPDLAGWLNGFLRPVLKSAGEVSPRLILNIADVSKIPLVQHTVQLAQEEGWTLRETLWMPLAALNRKNPKEPVLVFTR
jgi:DNA modification methylase